MTQLSSLSTYILLLWNILILFAYDFMTNLILFFLKTHSCCIVRMFGDVSSRYFTSFNSSQVSKVLPNSWQEMLTLLKTIENTSYF